MTTRRRITSDSDEWPDRLNDMAPLPPVSELFVEGLPLNPGERAVAVVGTRRPTRTGAEAATRMARGLAEAGYAVISGMALGIDQVAHKAALSAGGYTVAVLGCGLDIAGYPYRSDGIRKAIAAHGTVVSEYPDDVPPHPGQFPERNRVIAGLSRGVVVIEGGMRSGALITARLALDANREVWAVPGSIQNPQAAAPNHLIRTGSAALVTEVGHILESLEPGFVFEEFAGKPSASPALTDAESMVLIALDEVPISTDRLARHLKLPVGEVALGLARLEVRGLVTRRLVGYELSATGLRARESYMASQ